MGFNGKSFANAKGFKAENITFENSLNRYLTQEELADGADKNVILHVRPEQQKILMFVLKQLKRERQLSISRLMIQNIRIVSSLAVRIQFIQ